VTRPKSSAVFGKRTDTRAGAARSGPALRPLGQHPRQAADQSAGHRHIHGVRARALRLALGGGPAKAAREPAAKRWRPRFRKIMRLSISPKQAVLLSERGMLWARPAAIACGSPSLVTGTGAKGLPPSKEEGKPSLLPMRWPWVRASSLTASNWKL
jgi:hypothetical protein